MGRKAFYKSSSDPDVLYTNKDDAFDAAATACTKRGEPQVLMTVRVTGEVAAWEVIATDTLFDRLNQQRGAVVTVIGAA